MSVMQKTVRLRFKLYIMILPLVVVVVLLSGVLASLESRTALTRMANRHLAFKAEQLRDYFYSEWEVISDLGLSGQEEYRAAAQESLRSYAYSLLRSGTELIIAFDSLGNPAMQVGYLNIATGIPGERKLQEVPPAGWFSGNLLGEDRIGVVFELDPFGWKVAVTELQSEYFAEITDIQILHGWILAVAMVIVTIFLSVFIRYVIRPVEKLTGTITHITETKDLTRRAPVDYTNEIGVLAEEFNTMISILQENYLRLEETTLAESRARQTITEREEKTLFLLARVSEFRDEKTGEHLRRLGIFSELFGRLLGQSEDRSRMLRYAAPLHDIGKIGIPDSILRKQSRLSPEEFEIMKRHTTLGYDLLKDTESTYLIEGSMIALTHHERWDGTGYPQGLAGENIPLTGRIVAVIDVFDALTSIRPYKSAWNPELALKLILEERGKHFDPALVDIFRDNFTSFLSVLESELRISAGTD